MNTTLRSAVMGGALIAQLLGGCAADISDASSPKPTAGKADAVARLCEDAGLPDDCDICDVRGWYGDGECDDFCSAPDPDCGGDPGPAVVADAVCDYDIISPLADNSEELRDLSTTTRRVTFREAGSLTETELAQITAAVTRDYGDVSGESLETVFGYADEGTFDLRTLSGYDAPYDWVSFYSGDTEVGSIFESGSTRLAALIGDGEVIGCRQADPPPEVEAYDCSDAPHPFADWSHDIDIASGVTYGRGDIAAIPEINVQQIIIAAEHHEAFTRDAALRAAFDHSDDDEFDVLLVEIDGASYDWIRWWAGDTEVGLIFDHETLTVVAAVGDQDVIGCAPLSP